jgi:hypothetical protein
MQSPLMNQRNMRTSLIARARTCRDAVLRNLCLVALGLVTFSSLTVALPNSALAQGASQVVWESSYPLDPEGAQASAQAGVVAERLTIRADAGRARITDLELTTLEGEVITLDDLLRIGINANRFRAGLVDRTGDPKIARSISLDLGSRRVIESIEVALTNPIGAPGSFNLSLERIRGPQPNPQPPTRPAPQPVPPVNPEPNPQPPTQPMPPPPTPPTNPNPPAPTCDPAQLNQEIGMCRADRQNSQNRSSQMTNEIAGIDRRIGALAPIRQQYDQCLNESHRLTSERERLSKEIENHSATKLRLEKEIEDSRRQIQIIKNYPQAFRCWIRTRHGTIYEAQGPGSPMQVMRELAKTKCGEGECGKFNWNADWGCSGI